MIQFIHMGTGFKTIVCALGTEEQNAKATKYA